MGFNKKVLSQIKSDLNSAKAPARKKDIIVDPAGQWKHPGQTTRIPSNQITMQGVDYPVFAQPNVGQPQMMYPGQDYNFPGADYVDEYPQMKKGGQKKFSRSLEATNKLFTANPFVKKKKSKKKKIFNPNAKYYQDGGITKLTPEEEAQFQNFYSSLPENLQTDDSTYDIRGYWDSEGRPEAFNYNQPKEKDGYYHAYSINSNTGEYLKSPAHETFQHAVDEDRKIGYRPIPNVYGRNIATENPSIADQEEQSFLRNTEGPVAYQKGGKLGPIPLNSGRKLLRDWTYGETIGMLQEEDGGYIELDLTPEEIAEYKKGGYVVEDISIPSLTRFTKGGSKKKKKGKAEDTSKDFEFTADTQLYKMPTDPSRAYAKSGDGSWYEYKTYDAGFDQEGRRATQGYFTPIDKSYDVEKNLVPNITPMSDDEALGIKAGVSQMPEVKVKGDKWRLKDEINQLKQNYYENKLTPEEIELAKYNTQELGRFGSLKDAYQYLYEDKTQKLANLQSDIAYREGYLLDPAFDDGTGIDDSYLQFKQGNLAGSEYKSLEQLAKENGYADTKQFVKNLENLKKQDPYEYYNYLKNLTPGYYTPKEKTSAMEAIKRNDPTMQNQSIQASDWLWGLGVLGGAGYGAGAVGDLAAAAGDFGSALNAGFNAPIAGTAVSASDLATAYGIGNVANEWLYQPIVTGESPDFNPYNILTDAAMIASPFNPYANVISTAGTVTSGIEYPFIKGAPKTADEILLMTNTARGVSKLPKLAQKQYGGEANYEEAELTPEEIEEYRRQGYIIEEY